MVDTTSRATTSQSFSCHLRTRYGRDRETFIDLTKADANRARSLCGFVGNRHVLLLRKESNTPVVASSTRPLRSTQLEWLLKPVVGRPAKFIGNSPFFRESSDNDA